jgi:2-polyprenyl-3-methyl-5-hydroxy-6-metoxy-1,4-benzoquinol methylase
LCVADGEGRNSVWLAKQGMQVDAFDLSEVALKKAIALAKEEAAQVQFTLASSDTLGLAAKSVRCGSRYFYSVC